MQQLLNSENKVIIAVIIRMVRAVVAVLVPHTAAGLRAENQTSAAVQTGAAGQAKSHISGYEVRNGFITAPLTLRDDLRALVFPKTCVCVCVKPIC